MADSIVSSVTIKIKSVATASGDHETYTSPIDYTKTISFTDGTGANGIEYHWSDNRALSAASNEDLDLAGGLTDPALRVITFSAIKMIYIFSNATDGVLTVGGAASAQLVNWVSDSSDEVIVRPGGFLCLVAADATGYAVGAGTADELNLAHTGAAAMTYDIIIFGEGTVA